jgi:Transposase DDE domain
LRSWCCPRHKSDFPERLAADTAYGTGGNLAWLMQRGIEPHIPVLDRAGQTNGVFTRNEFTFDRDRNVFVCPGGKDLRLTLERDNGVRSRDCAHCPLKLQCTTAPKRSLSVSAHEEVRQHVAGLAATAAFKQSARELRKVEMLFAHLKRNLNFRRLRLRGMTGARDRMHARGGRAESPQARQADRLLAAAAVGGLRVIGLW